MNHNYKFKSINDALPRLLRDLMHSGDEITSRAGNTKEFTHVGVTLTEPWRRELLLELRKHSLAAQIAETAWVLAGRDDLEFLSNYLPRAKDFSDDGQTWRAGYGARLRHWGAQYPDEVGETDQISWVVEHLREQRASRQAVATIWDPATDKFPGKDIPCNDWLHFISRLGKLDLHVAVRSNDVVWGWSGINVFEWSTLLEVVAGLLGLQVGSLHFSITSLHIYDRHWAKAEKIVEYAAMTYPVTTPAASPRFDARTLSNRRMDGVGSMLANWFALEAMIRNGDMQADAVDLFPEPMFQSWLRVLQWWWSGNESFLEPLQDTPLYRSARMGVQPPEREIVTLLADDQPVATRQRRNSRFAEYVCELHEDKHAAYGDSWKKRGEMLGIMANIARKIDRLGGGETADETSADTAGDLLVYLAKYRTWLTDVGRGAASSDPAKMFSEDPAYANEIIRELDRNWIPGAVVDTPSYVRVLTEDFDKLEIMVKGDDPYRYRLLEKMLPDAYTLARALWHHEEAEQLAETGKLKQPVMVAPPINEPLPEAEYRGADVD